MWLYSCSREKSNRWKSRSEFQMFLLISGGHVCALRGTPTWRFQTELFKFQSNVSANNSTTEYHAYLRLVEVAYLCILYNITNSWLLSSTGFDFNTGGVAATFDLAAFGRYMIAPVKKSVNHSKTLTTMREMQRSVARTTREYVFFLFVVTRLWKSNSFFVIVYLLLVFWRQYSVWAPHFSKFWICVHSCCVLCQEH